METEIQGYLTEFSIIRGDIRNAVRKLNDERANWHPLPEGTNSIYVILSHVIDADNFWVRQVINGEVIRRDREAEFRATGNLPELLTRWEEAWTEKEAILGKLNHAQLSEVRPLPFRPEKKESVTIQWVSCILLPIMPRTWGISN